MVETVPIFYPFFDKGKKSFSTAEMKHRMICINVDEGVASPMRNMLTGWIWLNRMDRGTRTPKAPAMPWTMTKPVREQPLKKPMKQNKNDVSRQSMP